MKYPGALLLLPALAAASAAHAETLYVVEQLVVNLFADVLYVLLNPRLRKS